jgi:hypothetical protein
MTEEDMGRACGLLGEKKNACNVLVGKSEEKRALGKRKRG